MYIRLQLLQKVWFTVASWRSSITSIASRRNERGMASYPVRRASRKLPIAIAATLDDDCPHEIGLARVNAESETYRRAPWARDRCGRARGRVALCLRHVG